MLVKIGYFCKKWYNKNMEKIIGLVLMITAILVAVYIILHIDSLNNFSIPVPESIIKYFKVDAFK